MTNLSDKGYVELVRLLAWNWYLFTTSNDSICRLENSTDDLNNLGRLLTQRDNYRLKYNNVRAILCN